MSSLKIPNPRLKADHLQSTTSPNLRLNACGAQVAGNSRAYSGYAWWDLHRSYLAWAILCSSLRMMLLLAVICFIASKTLDAAEILDADNDDVSGISSNQTGSDLPIDSVRSGQQRLVKIYGAGGKQRLESYQSGILVAADGYVLTVWSYVLDVDPILVVLHDGRKLPAKLVGFDPIREIALLKCDAESLPYFDLTQSFEAEAGDQVYAISNLFGIASGEESASVQHGIIAAKTELDARRGSRETTITGQVYLLDVVVNNPGAAGGAITNMDGEFIGLIGKELRSSRYNTWVNYALPSETLTQQVKDWMSGKVTEPQSTSSETIAKEPITLELLGLQLVPDVVLQTPPYVDGIRSNSPSSSAGVQADDLILFVNGKVTRSCAEVRETFSHIERDQPIEILFRRAGEIKSVLLEVK
jgi:S1-C subfamily serine protease